MRSRVNPDINPLASRGEGGDQVIVSAYGVAVELTSIGGPDGAEEDKKRGEGQKMKESVCTFSLITASNM